MIDAKAAICVETYQGTQKGGKCKLTITVCTFLCERCGKEVRILKSHLSERKRVVCVACSNQERRGLPNLKNRKRPFESLYNRFLWFVKDRQLITDVTYESFVEFTKTTICHYCGRNVEWSEFYTNKNGAAYNLDRKFNGNYLKADLVVCCTRCNLTKADRFTYSEFVQIGETIRRFSHK